MMLATVSILALCVSMPADEKPKQKAESHGGSQSLVPGIPVSDPKIVREKDKPPTIFYPPSRASKKSIKVADFLVGVDDGVEWQGKIAYLTLGIGLVVIVDAKTEKTLWHAGASAFWDTMTFENMSKPNQPARWAVVLKSSDFPRYSQPYDLTSGERFPLRGGPDLPPGTILKPRKAWSGSNGVHQKPITTLVGSANEWSKLRKELFRDKLQGIPDASEIDFSKEMLLVLYLGRTMLRNGLSPALVVESEHRLVVRVEVNGYQFLLTPGIDIPEEHPYGLVVLPRRANKPVALEYNEQCYIGGPPMWKEKERIKLKEAPAAESRSRR